MISTIVFRGAEFYCLDCGRRLDFLTPHPQKETPENLERLAAYQKEWDDNIGNKLIVEGRVGTDEQQVEYDQAMAWLQERVKK